MVNNQNYGCTGGQLAPTTPLGMVTNTSPYGRSVESAGVPHPYGRTGCANGWLPLCRPRRTDDAGTDSQVQGISPPRHYIAAAGTGLHVRGASQCLPPLRTRSPLIKCGSFRRKTCSQSSIRAFSRTSKGERRWKKTFFISGIGGQGVQVLCKALATVVDECGMNMCLFPWYQGQRRGGATFGRLIISDERVGAPEKRHYDVCVYLDPASLRDYADKRRKGGLVIVNSDLVELPDFDDVTVVSARFPRRRNLRETSAASIWSSAVSRGVYEDCPGREAPPGAAGKTARNEQQAELYGRAFDMGVELAESDSRN